MSFVVDDIVVSEPGNTGPHRLAIAAPQLSWEINSAGSFSGFVRLDELRRAGLTGDLKGLWITYPSTAGWWGGIITGRPCSDGVAEIVAEGFASLLRGHVVTGGSLTMTGSAGGLAKRAIHASGVVGPVYIRLGSIDEGGGPVSLELTGDVATDVLPQIADAGDIEWLVDADRVFTLARRLGQDKSASVRLVEDQHILGVRVSDDLTSAPEGPTFRVQSALSQTVSAFTTRQRVGGVLQPPNNPAPLPPKPTLPSLWWQSAGAGTTYTYPTDVWESLPEGWPLGGTAPATARRRIERVYWQSYQIDPPGVISIPSVSSGPAAWVGRRPGAGANTPAVPSAPHLPAPTVPMELTLANIDDAFARIDLGDTVRVDVGSVGLSGRFRLKSKALDVASQSLSVAGDFLKDT